MKRATKKTYAQSTSEKDDVRSCMEAGTITRSQLASVLPILHGEKAETLIIKRFSRLNLVDFPTSTHHIQFLIER
jgi:hypothetical protein